MIPYKFSKESHSDLEEFKKVVQQQKNNKFCDINKYNTWKKIIPPLQDDALVSELNKQVELIEIEDSSDEEIVVSKIESLIVDNVDHDFNKTSVDDVTQAIKELLENQKYLPESLLEEISNYQVNKLDDLFSILNNELSLESVVNFGNSLDQNKCNNQIFSSFIQKLLLQKMKSDFSDKAQVLFNNFSVHYTQIFGLEIANSLIELEKDDNQVFLQYLSNVNIELKTVILRHFLNMCNKLCDNYITSIDVLLNPQIEYDSLNKLVQLLSNGANEFSKDKLYGKLLINVLNNLGKSILVLEQPLKHIIGKHGSIWKIKIQKLFNKCVEDNIILSQSFR